MSEEANSNEVFDPSDRPAAGTACVHCRSAYAHFCPAKGYAGDRSLCLACGAGQQCAQTVAVLRVRADLGYAEDEVDPRGLHGECRTVAIEEADRSMAEPEAASGWQQFKATLRMANLKHGPRKVRTEVKRKTQQRAGRRKAMATKTELEDAKRFALQEYPGISAEEVARRTGWSPYNVRKWIADAGMDTARGGGERVAASKTEKRLPVLEIIRMEEIPREPIDELISELHSLVAGQAIRFTAGSPLAAGKAITAAAKGCAELKELHSKRVDATVYFWFE